jgi:hypothetical protein
MKKQVIPNPGSKKAVALGCRCAVFDNYYGMGFMYGGERCFYINGDCPLHGQKSEVKDVGKKKSKR